MEKFFVEHHVMRDRDPDELRGQVASDSEASDAEEEITDRVHSVHDATGPWRQTPVDAPWGDPQAKKPGTKNRYFRSEHTGPKGVIKDYKAHKRYQREERERQEKARQDALLHIAKGVTVGSNQHAVCSAADCVCDDEDDMLLNDEFLQKYNAMRMYQMHETAKTRNRFGTLEYISPSEYLKLTDNLPSIVATIVHLYHPESYSCGLMNQHLEEIAKELVHIKFVALIAKEADESIAMNDVPVLLVYHGQQHDETIVGLSQKLDGEFTKQRIQQLVLHHTAEKAQNT